MIVFITLLVLPWSKCKFLVFLYSAPSSAVYYMFALYKYFIISKTLHKCMLFDYIYIYMGEGYMQGLIAVSKLIYRMKHTHKKPERTFLSWSVFSLGLTVSKVLLKMPTMQVNDISYIDLPVSSSIRLLLTEVFSWSCRSFSWHTVCSWAICSCRVVVCCPNCIDTSVKGQTRLGRSMLLLSSSFFFFFFWGARG